IGSIARRLCWRQVFHPNNPNHAGLLNEACSELHETEADNGIQDQRQADHHEDGPPIPKLILQFPKPDQANDGPAHLTVTPGPANGDWSGPPSAVPRSRPSTMSQQKAFRRTPIVTSLVQQNGLYHLTAIFLVSVRRRSRSCLSEAPVLHRKAGSFVQS